MLNTRKAALGGILAAALLSFIVILNPSAARADSVRLKNGDVITGSLIAADSKSVILDTKAAGMVTIDTGTVAEIKTDRIVTIEYTDGREVDGVVSTSSNGAVQVQEGAAPPAGEEAAPEGATALDLKGIASIHEVIPYYRYTAHLDFGLLITRGNSESENIALAGAFIPSFGKNTIIIDGQWNRAKAGSDLAASNWRLNGQYERDIWRGLFFLVFNGYEHDRLQDLDLRISVGSGLGYKFFVPDPTLLKVSLAPAFVDENFEGSDNDRQFAALRWTLDFDQDIFSPDVSVYHSHKLTIGLTEDQLILLTAQGLRFDLIAGLFLKAEFQFDYNHSPADDAKKEDYRYLLKIGYDMKGDENDWWR